MISIHWGIIFLIIFYNNIFLILEITLHLFYLCNVILALLIPLWLNLLFLMLQVVVFWTERQKVLKQAHQMQVFLEMTEQAKSWLASKEAFLNNDDVGVSVSAFNAYSTSWLWITLIKLASRQLTCHFLDFTTWYPWRCIIFFSQNYLLKYGSSCILILRSCHNFLVSHAIFFNIQGVI